MATATTANSVGKADTSIQKNRGEIVDKKAYWVMNILCSWGVPEWGESCWKFGNPLRSWSANGRDIPGVIAGGKGGKARQWMTTFLASENEDRKYRLVGKAKQR